MDGRAAAFWREFLQHTGRDEALTPYECFHFHVTQPGADELLKLVLDGKKRATTSSVEACRLEGHRPPEPGDLSVVTDWAGNPRCVIETESVRILPFREVDFDLARLEGEDENLESWQEGHQRFFTAEGAALGYAFSWDMPVAFETFRLVYPR
jgi:uncharacterized protein YhfF